MPRVPSAIPSLLLLLLLGPSLPWPAAAQDVLLDTFEDDTLGSPPAFPDLGFYTGSQLGTQTVIDGGAGDQRLRCLDDSAAAGCRLGYQTAQAIGRALTEYVFRIESGGTASGGANDFQQQLILSPSGTNLSIEWSAFARQLGVRVAAGGGETQFFVPNFQWAFDTDYLVEVETDADTDGYTISLDGIEIASDDFGVDLASYDRLTFSSAFATLGAFEVDDVRVSPLPEPAAAAAVAASWGALSAIARQRRKPAR